MTLVAPSDCTSATLVVLVTPVTSAPRCLPSCTMAVPTAPDAPTTRSVSPDLTRALRRKSSAVVPPNESDAASSRVRLAGLSAIAPFSGITRYSAWHPIAPPGKPKTSSPTRNFVTFLPTAATVPANSVPRTGCLGFVIPKTRRARGPKPFGTTRVRARQSPEVTVVASDSDEHLAVLWRRPRHLRELQHVGAAVAAIT